MSGYCWASTHFPQICPNAKPPLCPVLSHPPLRWPLLRFCKILHPAILFPKPTGAIFLPWEGVPSFHVFVQLNNRDSTSTHNVSGTVSDAGNSRRPEAHLQAAQRLHAEPGDDGGRRITVLSMQQSPGSCVTRSQPLWHPMKHSGRHDYTKEQGQSVLVLLEKE